MPVTLTTYLLTGLLLLALSGSASAQWPDQGPVTAGPGMHGDGHGPGRRSPYGAYCPKRHPDHYGARHPVRTVNDARERLLQFFGSDQTDVINLEERPRHFRANIVDKNGKLLDTVIIDRRSGRIRSIL